MAFVDKKGKKTHRPVYRVAAKLKIEMRRDDHLPGVVQFESKARLSLGLGCAPGRNMS